MCCLIMRLPCPKKIAPTKLAPEPAHPLVIRPLTTLNDLIVQAAARPQPNPKPLKLATAQRRADLAPKQQHQKLQIPVYRHGTGHNHTANVPNAETGVQLQIGTAYDSDQEGGGEEEGVDGDRGKFFGAQADDVGFQGECDAAEHQGEAAEAEMMYCTFCKELPI
jgi:hypothetical protein